MKREWTIEYIQIDTWSGLFPDLTQRKINRNVRKSEYSWGAGCSEMYSSEKRHDCKLCRIPPIIPFEFHAPLLPVTLGDKGGGDEGLVKERIDELISIELPSLDTREIIATVPTIQLVFPLLHDLIVIWRTKSV